MIVFIFVDPSWNKNRSTTVSILLLGTRISLYNSIFVQGISIKCIPIYNKSMKGLVLFYGQKSYPLDNHYLKQATWKSADINDNSEPDLVVDIFSPDAKSIILAFNNNELYDYVLVYNCFMTVNQFRTASKKIMLLARSLLKVNGIFIYHNYLTYVINYLCLSNKVLEEHLNSTMLDADYEQTEHRVYKEYNLASYNPKILNYLMMKEDTDINNEKFSLLNYALMCASTLSMETSFIKPEYLSSFYRPSNIGFANTYQESKKFLSLKFTASELIKNKYLVIFKTEKILANSTAF